MIRLIIDDSKKSSDDSDEEYIKTTRFLFFERAFLKMYFCGIDFENVFFLRE